VVERGVALIVPGIHIGAKLDEIFHGGKPGVRGVAVGVSCEAFTVTDP
jgi:hypothetical protein